MKNHWTHWNRTKQTKMRQNCEQLFTVLSAVLLLSVCDGKNEHDENNK